MIRYSTFALVALAAVLAAFTYSTGSRGVAATPKPTPVALQYDEISRMALPPATPPPPGTFHEDFVAAMNAPPPETPQIDPEAAAEMSRLGIKIPTNMGAFGAVRPMRYAFYRGWIRVDDLLAKTAEIRKCDVKQYIDLDLDKKTYRILSESGQSSGGGFSGRGQREGPGTAVMTVSRKSTNLGAKTLDGIPTTGYNLSNSMSITQAAGSCQNGSFSSSQVEYVSRIRQPQTFCPLGNAAMGMGTSGGGCSPTFTVQNSGGGPPDGLIMYSRTEMNAGGGMAPATVLERGNVRWLYKPEAEQAFSIPPGFTQLP